MPRKPMGKKKMQNMFRYGNFAIESYEGHPEALKRLKKKLGPIRLKKRNPHVSEVKREEEELLDE